MRFGTIPLLLKDIISQCHNHPSHQKFFNLMVLYQLQDLIITLHVMDQFKQFLYQMKGENSRI